MGCFAQRNRQPPPTPPPLLWQLVTQGHLIAWHVVVHQLLGRWHAGTAGGEAQQADIRQLLKELELKKAKLNELKGESRKAEAAIAKMRDDDTDAQRLTPDDCMEENAYIQVAYCSSRRSNGLI
jgi:hypothetical protein